MSAPMKCPNPGCSFLFDPAKVPPGAVLACPRCQMRFTLNGPVEAAAPTGREFGAAGSAATATPPKPDAAEKNPSFLESRGMIVVGLIACAAVVFALGVLLVSGPNRDAVTTTGETLYRDINLAIRINPDWDADAEARKLANVNVLAMKQANGSARIAIASKDYKTRMPAPGELRDGLMLERLERMFEDLDATPGTKEWLGDIGPHYSFRGRKASSGGIVSGEAWAATQNGHAYWMLAWADEADYASARPEIEAIRTSTRLIETKTGWKPADTAAVHFDGDAYTLTDGDRWFEKQADATTEDAQADMLLVGAFKQRGKSDNPPKARAVTFVLDGGDDAIGRFRGFVKDRYKKLFDIAKWVEVKDAVQGDPPVTGAIPVESAERWHAQHAEDARVSKFVVLKAVALPGGKIAGAEVSCPWSDRKLWEHRLACLAASLKQK
jgi:hypothetical protein